MNDALFFALLFCAIACGWWLGRRSIRASLENSGSLPDPYYQGLNYLLDGSPDSAVDHFVSALEVNSEPLETHIALGNALRRRGEVDRAIRVHENLLTRPGLSRSQRHVALLELARDYIAAGLLDRAEELLTDLVAESEEQRDISRQHLLEIYRSESEWRRAIQAARALLPKKRLLRAAARDPQLSGQSVSVQLAHFYCELALQLIKTNEHDEARKMLHEAQRSDPGCARASLELGRLEASLGNHRRAIDALTRVVEQHTDLLPEAIPVLRECHIALGEEQALSAYLSACLDRHSSTPLMIAVADDIRRDRGLEAARDFLTQRLAQVPSLRGLLRLIRLQQEEASDEPQGVLGMLGVLLDRLVEERPTYRCEQCGFAARQLLWFCPGCKYWGTFRTIRTTEAE